MSIVCNIKQVGKLNNRRLLAADAADYNAQYIPVAPKFINWLKGLFIEPRCPGTGSM